MPALGQFLGSTAGLSAPVITKLTEQWKTDQRVFSERDLSDVDYVYLWADGIHVNIRLEEHKLCLLVMIGVRADGRDECPPDPGGQLRDVRGVGRHSDVCPQPALRRSVPLLISEGWCPPPKRIW